TTRRQASVWGILHDEGWSRPQSLARRPSLERHFGRRASRRSTGAWAQALSGINQHRTLIFLRLSTLEHYDFIERIAFVRKTPHWSQRQISNCLPRSSIP